MFYQNAEEKKRVEDIMSRLHEETFIKVRPASCGKCSAFPTKRFQMEFGKECDDIVTILALYLYTQGDFCSAYNKFTFETKQLQIKQLYVIRNDNKLVFCTEQEHKRIEVMYEKSEL